MMGSGKIQINSLITLLLSPYHMLKCEDQIVADPEQLRA